MNEIRVEYFYAEDDRWWARAHVAGCRDVLREIAQHGGAPILTEVASERGLIEEVASDFIFSNDRQPWTDYVGQVSLAPCLQLPGGDRP